MLGYVEYEAPEADPIADLADAVDNSPLQQNKKFVDNTEYYLIPVAVIDALLVPDETVDEEVDPEFEDELQHPGYGGDAPVEVEAALARADDEFEDETGDEDEVPGTYAEDHGPDETGDDRYGGEYAEDDKDIAS